MPETLTMNPHPAPSEPAETDVPDSGNSQPPRKPTRFTYASGTRPLEGYTIKRGVGSGGFGEVYFAVSDAGKEVALKLIRRNLEVELRGVKQCLNLKHPNLVALFDIRTDDLEDQWVVMEYVSGASLEDMIERYPEGMPKDMALAWFEGIASAVAYLHDHGIVHRDLKPANIFIDEGRVKIGDYGLSKFISCSRRSGQTESVGTVHYMAPEIANGRYGREIDTYALGIIFYEMLTGHVPFEGESVGEVLMKHLTAEPDFTVVEEPYRQIIQGAMAKDPDKRIKSVAEMLAILRADGSLKNVAGSTAFAAAAMAGSPAAGVATAAGTDPGEPEIHLQSQKADTADYSGEPVNDAKPIEDDYYTDLDFPVEPIAAGVMRGVDNIGARLGFHNWAPVQKIAGFLLLVIALVATGAWIPLFFACCVYGFYWVIWALLNPPHRERTFTRRDRPRSHPAGQREFTSHREPGGEPGSISSFEPQSVESFLGAEAPSKPKQPTYTKSPWRKRKNQGWRHAAYRELADRTLRQRASSLFGALLSSAIVASVTALVACIFSGASHASLELSIWTVLTTILASWAVIVPAKLTEGRFEDQAPMRFIMLFSGALLGLSAYVLAQTLMLDLPVNRNFVPGPHDTLFAGLLGWTSPELKQGYFDRGAVSLPLAMFASYFTILMVGLRWWRHADYTRNSRVSVWSIAVCGAASWGLSLITWFPQPVGMIVVMATAFTVQLTSHWMPPSRRRELAGEVV
ncbi:MAG: bifunctional serine/threonine protein kinase/MFS transporter [Lacipirellulaceae bacterium]